MLDVPAGGPGFYTMAGFHDYTVEVFGEPVEAQRHDEAPYDPAGGRMRS